MRSPLSESALAQLFTEARSHHHFRPDPVSDETLHTLYELCKWGPTSVNSNPARILYIRSAAEKERLVPHLLGSNVEQVRAAPVVAIVAYDAHFLDQITRLFPAVDVRPYFAGNEGLIHDTAFRNSTLQGAYFIMAARALGLDVCPMSGFNNAGVDEAFFQDRGWRSNFLCTLGYGDETRLFPRGPRLSFSEACDIV
ncbi:MAG TPA: malonic semialdehyde reductase [Pseudomonadota bacterium]|nr:malonic semialdehyde reductase [Pseudomonadota bacterium]